jgi:glutamate synthase domain-containing protein 2/glutamate synthase domain-containing protein 1/glutamate synthase domain-containing protein 3
MNQNQRPKSSGLYDPRNEHDACGIGAIVNISGKREHKIVEYGNQVLMNLIHRGASGADESTGDGAGMLMQIPHELFVDEMPKLKIDLPKRDEYGVAMVFGLQNNRLNARCNAILEKRVIEGGLKILGWRKVPTDNSCLGDIAKASEPKVSQLFIEGNGLTGAELERRLFVIRKRVEHQVRNELGQSGEDFYLCSISCRTIVYKGMFLAPQLTGFFPDLLDPRTLSAMAIVHQRYSTNTFPSWKLAQPFRMIAHNGEINTLRGNINRLRGAEKMMECPELADDLSDLFPIIEPDASDSASFDNAMELLVRAGRSAPHSLMMMIPEAFGPRYHISIDKRAFYEYHASMMEPWDGPAAIAFTDGRMVGGTLDRNGLRPCRYVVTTDDLVVMASEAGVIEFPVEQIRHKGRLQPGRMFLVDTEEGRIVMDNEIKGKIIRQKPYRRWLNQNRIELRGLFQPSRSVEVSPEEITQRQRCFGYTREELQSILVPMATNSQEPLGSMGTDTPLAVLSDRPKLLFTYFKQLFAQVTNPPIDPLREGLVMSLMAFTGKQRNLLCETPGHCRQLKLSHPILTNEDIERLRHVDHKSFHVATIETLFEKDEKDPGGSLRRALKKLVDSAAKAIKEGASLLILSDRNLSETRIPIPSLLATGAVHHGLLKRRLRNEVGIVVESGEPREVMHFCLLCGYGANAINPYMAFESIQKLHADGYFNDDNEDIDAEQLSDQYITAVKKGLLKTMSKMGISTLRSYHSAQQFEAIGLSSDLVNTYFTGTASRIEGISLETIAGETLTRHKKAFGPREPAELDLIHEGEYQFRRDGEFHYWNPETISLLQQAVINNDKKIYSQFAENVNDQSRKLCTLRGLFDFVPGKSVPIDEVEPASEIVKRFYSGAMSHGSISKEAHETMAIAMNRLGGQSNTGEGGEDPSRYTPLENGDSANSSVKQVASGRFGVTIEYLAQAKMLQIKMAQGAKPGEGGQLPGQKVTEEIARLRYSTPGVSLISPPPHHDIYSIEDLAQLIYDLKCSNPGVLVSVKLVSEVGVGTVAAGVAKGHADEVLISGHDGGTGASPLSSLKSAGAPWEIGLAETQQTLVLNGLRDRILVQTDGQLRTGRDVVIAALLGAERFGFGTSILVSMGCILMRKCHLGTCPVGIATQEQKLRDRFGGQADFIVRYLTFLAEEVREIMAQLGFRTMDEMIGSVSRIASQEAIEHWKAKGLDFSAIFTKPDQSNGSPLRSIRRQPDQLADHLDWKILKEIGSAIEKSEPTEVEVPIRNVHRTVGAILSNKVFKQHGSAGLPDDTLKIVCRGTAGQSFGAFLTSGVTLHLIGESNDYLGKGLSGGRIIVQKPEGSLFSANRNVIVGNTLLYGATQGEAFINGLAGERFAVRNSGVTAVVEGVGDHGCEYMTGGTVVVIGTTGRNFAAGMSGGVAYVLDEHQLFDTLCNLDMVDLEPLWRKEDRERLHHLIRRHFEYTKSRQAERLLDKWHEMAGQFVKVMPIDYRRALKRLAEREQVKEEQSLITEEVYNG